VGQFLIEDAIKRGQGGRVSVVCTQPRRISTLSLAQRVAAEQCDRLGGLVGYKVRLESCTSPTTRLRRLLVDTELADVTHVIIDEVHERHVNTDFLMIALKEVLARRPTLKLILMSATLDADRLSEYWGGAPHIAMPGRTFPVEDRYLEDLLQESKYKVHTEQERRDARSRLQEHQQEGLQGVQGAMPLASGQAARVSRKGLLSASASREEMGNIRSNTLAAVLKASYGFELKSDDYPRSDYSGEVVVSMESWLSHKRDMVDPYLAAAAVRHLHATQPTDGAILVILPGWDDIMAVHSLLTCPTQTWRGLYGKDWGPMRPELAGAAASARAAQRRAREAEEAAEAARQAADAAAEEVQAVLGRANARAAYAQRVKGKVDAAAAKARAAQEKADAAGYGDFAAQRRADAAAVAGRGACVGGLGGCVGPGGRSCRSCAHRQG